MQALIRLFARFQAWLRVRRDNAGFEGIVDRVDLDARLRSRGLGGL
jgi:hypothetical protein